MSTIGVKFCGGCNPQIDRGKLFKQLKEILSLEHELLLDLKKPWDIGILLSGCPNACNDDPDVRKLAPRWILISGAMVDYFAVDENLLAEKIAKKIQDFEQEMKIVTNLHSL